MGQKGEVDVGMGARLAAQAEHDEIDEGALAAAGVAEQHETRVTVKLFERRETKRKSELVKLAAVRPLALLVAASREKRGVDGVKRKARTRIGRGQRVDSPER